MMTEDYREKLRLCVERNRSIVSALEAGQSMGHVADLHGISLERVRQIRNKAIREGRRRALTGLPGLVEAMPYARGLRTRAHRWLEAAGITTLEELVAFDRGRFVGPGPRYVWDYETRRSAWEEPATPEMIAEAHLYRNYGRKLHQLLNELIGASVGPEAVRMTEREARRWVRRRLAAGLLEATAPDDAPQEAADVWQDEMARVARSITGGTA